MDGTLNIWAAIAACGIVTFLTRLSFIAVHGRVHMPEWFQHMLTFVPVAVLSAIALPEIVIHNGSINWSPLNPKLLGPALAVAVAWRTKNVWGTIAAGMAAMWGLRLLIGA
ncbi:MAG TPA: AzlD domain-containing protein [Syntrophales bacterium]|nr:AzlD domain-containing protein [Syntrophales bacterium]